MGDLGKNGAVTTVTVVGIAAQAHLAGHQGEIGHRGRQIQLEFRLGPSEIPGLPHAQLLEPSQPMLRHHPSLLVLVIVGTLLQRPGLLQQALMVMDQHPPSFAPSIRDATGAQQTPHLKSKLFLRMQYVFGDTLPDFEKTLNLGQSR